MIVAVCAVCNNLCLYAWPGSFFYLSFCVSLPRTATAWPVRLSLQASFLEEKVHTFLPAMVSTHTHTHSDFLSFLIKCYGNVIMSEVSFIPVKTLFWCMHQSCDQVCCCCCVVFWMCRKCLIWQIWLYVLIIFFSCLNTNMFVISENMMDELERIYRRAGSRKLWSDILTHTSTNTYTVCVHMNSKDAFRSSDAL